MNGLTLDTGALIAFERHDRKIIELLEEALRRRYDIVVPATVVAQAWRDPRRQARLVRLLANEALEIEPLDALRAKQAGQLCGVRNTSDVVDASVVLCARARKHRVVTSDPDDLRRLDPNLELIEI
jgi:predicted nucleic acid-binding protein